MRLILASTSPRRREILALLGVPFETLAPDFAEVVSANTSIAEEVLGFAVGKARSVARSNLGSIVIGSDTMISLDGEKIGKPRDEADARRILESLSGKGHTIYTGVAILDSEGGEGRRHLETIDVQMRNLDKQDIDRYLAAGESMDKAGAYSIQGFGRTLITSVRGDYLAAVGMPLKPIADYLKSRGVDLNCDPAAICATETFQRSRCFESI